ncbi:hypothetical protein FHP29_20870 [Nocardioides albidus]|uniref:Uncharacterized protein n=1 Tax=Nocardioides albidus TaxID=1517589 RepID=A0A5C4VLA3_9ACTN|nr:hypothetical protein [Nocardioides albidus]TNM36582.1 hypothetical protein FHP29_20870 [Nocardioides albidus]
MTALPLHLPEPALGPDRLRHDAEFRALDRTFDRIRDTVNLGIDVLNDLGVGLRRLPEESLQELVVLPLSGDYRRIRQNAEAIGYVDAAMARYAGSTLRLAVAADPRWTGDAAAAYLLRLGRHAAAARGAGALLALAVPAFEEVARFAERVAVEVEELVVELVERGTRLMMRLLARAAGPAGWAVFAAEVALEGLDAIADLVDDARRLVAIVDRLLEMKGEMVGWVEEQVDRLARLREVADVARAELDG